MPKSTHKAAPFEQVSLRAAIKVALAAAVLAVLFGTSSLRDALDLHVAWPLAARWAAALGHAPEFDSRLEVFAQDDGAPASSQHKTPSGHVITAAKSVAMPGDRPAPLPLGLPLAALLAAALATLGIWQSGYLLAAWTMLATAAIALAGLSLQAYAGRYAPWLPAILAGLIGAGLASARRAAHRLEDERGRSVRNEREEAKLVAIVKTAQMFAHDVRKPFSMLKMAVEAVQREDDPARSHALFVRLFPELARAMAAVEGMIQDIMEIDAEARLTLVELTIEQLLEQTLEDAFLVRQDAEVAFSYELSHLLDVAVDSGKVRRALVNIVTNAVEAMDGRGRIWFRTEDVIEGERSFVELTIGNDGAPIPHATQGRVFEAFFTASKKRGSGLGLAIAHKAVTAHGGRITCSSSRESGTEFTLTLPAAHTTPRQHDASGLPTSTKALWDPQATKMPRSEPPTQDEEALSADAADALRALGRPLPVLVIDDEDFYREALTATLTALVPSGRLAITGAADATTALSCWRDQQPALVLCDVDLGPESANGFEVIRQIKAESPTAALVVIHSNRVLPADARTGEAAGADAFLSKPASKASLLQLLLDAAKLLRAAGGGLFASQTRPHLAVVDDSPFTLEAWKLLVKDADVSIFECPKDFWRAVAGDAGLLAGLACVVTDYYFDNESDCNGVDFAHALKTKRHDLPVYLSSNAELFDVPANTLDGHIGKEPVRFAEIKQQARKVG